MLRGDAFRQELKSQRSLFRTSPWSSLACILLPFFFFSNRKQETGSQRVKNSKADGPTKSLLGQKQYAWQGNKEPIYEQQRPTHPPPQAPALTPSPTGLYLAPSKVWRAVGTTGRGTHLFLILLSQALSQEPRGQRQTNQRGQGLETSSPGQRTEEAWMGELGVYI